MEEEDYEDENNAITLHITTNVNKEWIDAKSVHETLKVVKKI